MATTDETVAAGHALTERLAFAKQELDAFERQPPLGARAYIRGRNSRAAVIAELQEELAHA